jgi:hypothetical protein
MTHHHSPTAGIDQPDTNGVVLTQHTVAVVVDAVHADRSGGVHDTVPGIRHPHPMITGDVLQDGDTLRDASRGSGHRAANREGVENAIGAGAQHLHRDGTGSVLVRRAIHGDGLHGLGGLAKEALDEGYERGLADVEKVGGHASIVRAESNMSIGNIRKWLPGEYVKLLLDTGPEPVTIHA